MVERDSPSPKAIKSQSPAIMSDKGSTTGSISSNTTVVELGSSRKASWRSKTWKGQQNPDEEKKVPTNYPRKHSLTVPGEPRHIRTLHRRESGSHSPIDSSYNELSTTPSPSCSNSINEDHSVSSCGSSTGLANELSRKCTVSADSLLLQHCINNDDESAARYVEDLRSASSLKPSLAYIPGQRRISSSVSSDRIHQPSKNECLKLRSVTPAKISKEIKVTQPETTVNSGAGTSDGSSTSSSRRRKGSMAFVSTGKIAKLLRRTHSAGCSKDVPSYALFMSDKHQKTCRSSESKEHKRGRKQAPALEDMKQRLRFLRRRHTDSSIEQSVRPSKDEVEKWANSFIDLMSSRYGSALFRAFLSREFSEENIEFWIACEDFKKSRQNQTKTAHKARKIFDDFLAIKAPKEVNLDPKLRTSIMQTLTNPGRNAFDIAQRKVQGLLESDAYLRFLRSELYLDLIPTQEPTIIPETTVRPMSESEDS